MCKLSLSEFSDLIRDGDPWSYNEMKSFAAEFRDNTDRKKKPVNGIKNSPWWTMIPLQNIIVPLLHYLIGIGDNILTKFRDIISEHIEYLSPDEVKARLAIGAMEEKIDEIVEICECWDKTDAGKRLKSAKSKLYRARKGLDQLVQVNAVASAGVTGPTSLNQTFLDEVMLFIENDEAAAEQDDGTTKRPVAASTTSRRRSIVADKPDSELTDIERKIK